MSRGYVGVSLHAAGSSLICCLPPLRHTPSIVRIWLKTPDVSNWSLAAEGLGHMCHIWDVWIGSTATWLPVDQSITMFTLSPGPDFMGKGNSDRWWEKLKSFLVCRVERGSIGSHSNLLTFFPKLVPFSFKQKGLQGFNYSKIIQFIWHNERMYYF